MRDDDEAALGRTLAETAAINAPETRAGREAADSLRRAMPDPTRAARNRRRFWLSCLLLVLLIALAALALAVLAP